MQGLFIIDVTYTLYNTMIVRLTQRKLLAKRKNLAFGEKQIGKSGPLNNNIQ